MVESSNTQASPISSQPAGPRDVVAAFLRLTVDTPDLKKARLHLTRRSMESGDFHAAPAGSTYTLGAEEADELGRRIPVSVKSPVPGGTDMREMTVPVIVVQEEGLWKIDLPATMDRLMGGMTQALGQAASAMGEALSTAMTGVGEALAEGLGDAPAPAAPSPAPKPAVKKPIKAAHKPAPAAMKPAKKAAPKPKQKAAAKVAKRPAKKSARVSKKVARKPGKKRRK